MERRQAMVAEQVQTYGKTVAQAMQDVENALSAERQQQAKVTRIQEQLHYARLAFQEARTAYLGGRDSFLNYSTQLQTVQKLERSLVREQASLLSCRVTLCRALGGDWFNALRRPALSEKE